VLELNMHDHPEIERVRTRAFRIPTDEVEADGTIAWDSTTLVVIEIEAGGKSGLGYTYAGRAAGAVIEDVLARAVEGQDAFAVPMLWTAMVSAVRNLGWRGVCACAISAVDVALWD
jgi:L-alanine-DL-glutamate epimerase-like enolase superfamily enzyme